MLRLVGLSAAALQLVSVSVSAQQPQHCSTSSGYGNSGTIGGTLTWDLSDVDASTQDFSQVAGGTYLGADDFDENGGYIGDDYPALQGESWETVFLHNKDEVRPLGFQYAYLGPNNMPTVCLNATNAAGFQVELMVYAMTRSASLCMQDMAADAFANDDTGAVSFCDRGEVYGCFIADTTPGVSLQVAVYCDTDCEDGQGVDLLWRFRRSQQRYQDNQVNTGAQTDMWCMNIAGSKDYPNDLLSADIPNNVVAGGNEQAGALQAALAPLAALAAASLLVFAA